MKSFCLDLKEHVTKIINHEKKMMPLTKEGKIWDNDQKVFCICKKVFRIKNKKQ